MTNLKYESSIIKSNNRIVFSFTANSGHSVIRCLAMNGIAGEINPPAGEPAG
jgi:hypothetical protein